MATALITGASGGIGRSLAQLFAAHSIDLILVARSEDKLNALAKSLKTERAIKVSVIVCDLVDASSLNLLLETLNVEKIDFLVNNAGIGDFGLFSDSDWAKQQQMIDLNISALTQLTHVVLPGMLQRGEGKILNIASTAAFVSGPIMSVYYATKAYVLSFSEALHAELKGTGVTVTTLCPGPTATDFQSRANMKKSKMAQGVLMPSSDEVAKLGFEAMMKGQRLTVQGLANKAMLLGVGLLPRRMRLKIIKLINTP